MRDFKEETEAWIASLIKDEVMKDSSDIDELKFSRPGGLKYTQIGGPIDWDAAQKALELDSWEYDDGFGCQEFCGFITFKNSNMWLQRKEYDGSEWWGIFKKPKLGFYE